MTNNKLKLTVLFLLCISFISYKFNKSTFIHNGNNKENIVETIQSLDNDQNNIEVIKIFNVENERYVAYLKNNIPAYIHFKKDYFGNYKFFNDEYGVYNENDLDTNLQDFVIPRGYKDNQPLPLKLMVISNYENTVSKLSVRLVNTIGITEKVEIKVGKSSAKIITMKKATNEFSLEHTYYDEYGKEIKQD